MDGTRPANRTKTTCPYCGVGCGVLVTRHDDGLVQVEGDPDHPANFGRLCSKGSALAETLGLDDRLLYPEINGRQAKWDDALDLVATQFKQTIAAHGPESVAFYISGQLLTEDYYVANKLMKGFIGSANIDTNSRLCMASTVVGHNRAFGGDVVPGCYEDLERADLIVLVGSNLAWCHPVLFQRIMAAKDSRPHMRLVVIDPRRTVTADAADLHLPIRADGDVALYNLILKRMIERDQLDHEFIAAHTDGFSDIQAHVVSMDADALISETGLPENQIDILIDWICDTEKTVTVFSQGVNQSTSGSDKVNAIINTHLATGRISKPGMGPFSVTGQPNAMGGREVGGLANQLAAHMKLDNLSHRDTVQRFWQSPVIADKDGYKAVELFERIAQGDVKAVWIMATNPVDSLPRTWAVEDALKSCPFVVVSENIAVTDTARHAHVKLPASAWGEKTGTVTNSERCISRQRSFSSLPGDARHDWWIVSEVAKRMGWGDAFDYHSPADVYREHAALSGFENTCQRAFNVSAHADITDPAYDALRPQQWPIVDRPSDTHRVLADGEFFTASRRGKFLCVDAKSVATSGQELVLNTGRVRDHWHTMTRTGKASTLSGHYAEPFIALNPDNAAKLDISHADLVQVKSGDQWVIARAQVTDRQGMGTAFMPMHWTDQFSSAGRVGRVVDCGGDPFSGQPALKTAKVEVSKYQAKTYGFAMLRHRPSALNAEYWALASCQGGYRLELAFLSQLTDPELFFRELINVDNRDVSVTSYADEKTGQYRFTANSAEGLLGTLYLATEPVKVSRSWAVSQLSTLSTGHSQILAGRAGADAPDPGPIVCACFSVGANEIKSACKSGCTTVDQVGEKLGAGTNCGSCKTEIQNTLRDVARVS